MTNSITWDAFERNCGSEGLQKRFESLCRQLFCEKYAAEEVYPLYQENNPGLETEPVLYKGKRIGFQAKYFTSSGDKYSQLSKSVTNIIARYKGKVDVVIFYTNKPLSENVQKKLKDKLETEGFDVQFRWGDNILDAVRKNKGYIKEYYFGYISFDQMWFNDKYERVRDEINPEKFISNNVETEVERELSVFTHSSRGADIFNRIKEDSLSHLRDLLMDSSYKDYTGFIAVAIQALEKIGDVDEERIADAGSWGMIFSNAVSGESGRLEGKLKQQKESLKEEESQYRCGEISREIDKIETLISLSEKMKLCKYNPYLKEKVLVLSGSGGYGKTHSLLNEYCSLHVEERECLFIRGKQFCKSPGFAKQITELLEVPLSLENFIECLELSAVDNGGRVVTLIIDALNEASENNSLEDGLSRLINIINRKRYVRLIVSCRDEYIEKIIPHESEVPYEMVEVDGFSGDGKELVTMLQRQGIPFSSGILFNDELKNPLFCSLYCENYVKRGESVFSLHSLFEEIVKDICERSYHQLEDAIRNAGGRRDFNWALELIENLAGLMMKRNSRRLSLSDLRGLSIWTDYGLPLKSVMEALVERGVLYSFQAQDNEIYYSFFHQKFRDYYLARNIVKSFNTEQELRKYIEACILPSVTAVSDFNSDDLFAQVAYQYALKFRKECCDLLMNRDDLEYYRREYIKSFAWRKDNQVTADELLATASSFGLETSMDFWKVFFSCSLDTEGNFNAKALHRILGPMSLTQRDYCWTIAISSAGVDDPDLIDVFRAMADGSSQIELTPQKKELLLLFCSWLLTSTNRELRDTVSKAMIVVLKDDIFLCEKLLRRFEAVNDPYVLERLFEIALGVVTRSDNIDESSYSSLVRFVHSVTFVGAEAYPDIAVIDASYLIIRHFLYLFPKSELQNELTMKAAYNPEIFKNFKPTEYKIKKEYCGYNHVIGSMEFALGVHMYGDFGRYVFQSSLPELSKEDQKAVHDYALDLIFTKYKYDDRYFDDFDQKVSGNTNRYGHAVERIGKKYEWLAYFETLSRVLNRDNNRNLMSVRYRTFDPTANYTLSKRNEDKQAVGIYRELYSNIFIRESGSDQKDRAWIEDNWELGKIVDKLCVTIDGSEWVNLCVLSYLCVYANDEENPYACSTCSFKVTGWFLPGKQAEKLRTLKEKGKRFFFYDAIEIPKYPYSSYVRTYPWDKDSMSGIERFNMSLELEVEGSGSMYLDSSFVSACKIEPGFEYDYSEKSFKDNTEHLVPCSPLIETLGLGLRSSSDFGWYSGGDRVCYCYSTDSGNEGLLIRKDYLKKYLKDSKLELVWFVAVDKSRQSGYRQYHGYIGYSNRGLDKYVFMDDVPRGM